jgi:hypothetical protein
LNCILIGDVLLYIQCGEVEEERERREKERGRNGDKEGGGKEERRN